VTVGNVIGPRACHSAVLNPDGYVVIYGGAENNKVPEPLLATLDTSINGPVNQISVIVRPPAHTCHSSSIYMITEFVPFPVKKVDLQEYIKHNVKKAIKPDSLKQYLGHIKTHNIAIGGGWNFLEFEPIIEEGLRRLNEDKILTSDEAHDDANNTIDETFLPVEPHTDTNEQSTGYDLSTNSLSQLEQYLSLYESVASTPYDLQQDPLQAWLDLDQLAHFQEDQAFYNNAILTQPMNLQSEHFSDDIQDSELELENIIQVFQRFNSRIENKMESRKLDGEKGQTEGFLVSIYFSSEN
ncbi:22059_t:CDS:2, partial [Dentiscutata erythropus]